MEKRKLVTPDDIRTALKDIGVQKGQVVMVHTSLSSLGYVCGGAQSIIEALMESVGDEGTIMMPTQSWKNLDPAAGVTGRNRRNGGRSYVNTYPLMTNGLRPQIQWAPYQKCSGSGRGHLEAITLQGQWRRGDVMHSI